MYRLGLDIGYSSTKLSANGKLFKLPTAISFAIDTGINYGEDEIYEYNGKKYRVGDVAIDESFTTTKYEFLEEFGPLILFHVLNKLNLIKDGKLIEDIDLRTGLALADWSEKERFVEKLKTITVNGITLNINNINIIPQGAGVYYSYIHDTGTTPESAAVIDIGFNTINFLAFQDNMPIRAKCKSFPTHGVVSIIRPFTNWLEAKFKDKFTEQEAIKILLKKKYVFGGREVEGIPEMITELKNNFIQKLFNSILVSEKKILGTSEKVIIAGGGAYLLEDVEFPPNVVFPKDKLYEFENVKGYVL